GKAISGPVELGNVLGVAWSPDGRRIATGSEDDGPRGGMVRLWDATTGRPGPTFPCDRGPDDPSQLAFSADGKLLLGPGLRWSLETGKRTQTLPTGWPLAYSRDGRSVALGDGSSVALKDSRGRRTLLWGAGEPRCLAFSPDGRLVAVGAKGMTVH